MENEIGAWHGIVVYQICISSKLWLPFHGEFTPEDQGHLGGGSLDSMIMGLLWILTVLFFLNMENMS